MIKQLDDMPDGVIGLEASGEVTADDYRDVMVPVVTAAMEQGGVRLLYVMAEHAKFSPGAAFADAKLGISHLRGWEKVAVVSDADWLENSIKAFGWMMPGEVKVFDDDEVDEAKARLVQPRA
ncbi:MAG: STAS/SEC14 domain-containing protein [Nocardioides sp.]|nr:STAS/SEC14 domain-containing protein [Nocardioides sp.]